MKKVFFVGILAPLLFCSFGLAKDKEDFDAETQVQIQKIVTHITGSDENEKKVNESCAFRSKPPHPGFKLLIERITKDSVEGRLTLGDVSDYPVSFEHSGQKQDIHVYTWWKDYWATVVIRVYVAKLEPGKQSVTIEVKDGWFSEKSQVTSICHLEDFELDAPIPDEG